MSTVRRRSARENMPVARAVMEPLERADPFTYSSRRMWTHENEPRMVKRQDDEAAAADEDAADDDDEDEDEDEDESESNDEEAGELSSDFFDGTSSEGASDAESDVEVLAAGQQKAIAAPPALEGSALISWRQLGALPMPPMNTKRSIDFDKIKRKPKRSVTSRQEPASTLDSAVGPSVPDLGPLPMPALTVRGQTEQAKVKRASKQVLDARQSSADEASLLPTVPELGPLPVPSLSARVKRTPEQSLSSKQSIDAPEASSALPSIPYLGPLPTLAVVTRRSLKREEVKKQPKRSLSRRQVQRPTPTDVTLPPPEVAVDLSSEDEFEDPLTSESEDESSTTNSTTTSTKTRSTIDTTPSATMTSGSNRPSSAISTPTRSAFIVVDEPTPSGNSAIVEPMPTLSGEAAGLSSGIAPESRIAIIAGTTIIGIALLITALFCLFRYCIPARTWLSTHRQRRRDLKAQRLGTSPQPWKWPLQFIFGSDRPAPPRPKFTGSMRDGDLESNPTVSTTLVADGFRPATGDAGPYKPKSGNSATAGWVSNGFYNPFTRLSERLSGWPRRSGTHKWFGSGGGGNPNSNTGNTKDSSRWSDSDASSDDGAAHTTYSEATFLKLYEAGASPSPRMPPSVSAKNGGMSTTRATSHIFPADSVFSEKKDSLVQISQVEVTPPLPSYQPSSIKSSTMGPPKATTGQLPRRVPSYASSISTASSASTLPILTRSVAAAPPPPPAIPAGTSHRGSAASILTSYTTFTTAEIGTAVAVSLSSSSTSTSSPPPALPRSSFLASSSPAVSASTLTSPSPLPKPAFSNTGGDTSHFSISTAGGGETLPATPFSTTEFIPVKLPPIPRGLVRPEGLGPGVAMSVRGSGSSFGSVGVGVAEQEKEKGATRPGLGRKGSMRGGGVRSVGERF